MTRRAMDFMDEAGDAPWLCHLSYIKPHWPYIVPAPYHNMYGAGSHPAAGALAGRAADRSPGLRRLSEEPHVPRLCQGRGAHARDPRLYGPDQADRRPDGEALRLDGGARPVREHHDRLHLRPRRLSRRPLDGREGHVPRSVGARAADRLRSRPEADATRGTVCDALVEASIWRRPSWNISAGRRSRTSWKAGRSAHSFTQRPPVHGVAMSSPNTTTPPRARTRSASPAEARLIMAFDGRWKYIHCEGFRPMLFDLEADPQELSDLGGDPAYEAERARLTRPSSPGRATTITASL